MKHDMQYYWDKLTGKLEKLSLKKILGAGIALALIGAVVWFFSYFSVSEVTVLGNVHYTEEEIRAEVEKGFFGSNAFVVSHTRKSFSPDDLELVDQIDVEMQGHHALKITVQERQLIGYVQYLDSDLYFDSEGRIMYSVVREEESADAEEEEVLTAEAVGKTATSYVAAMKEAPLIQGLSFDSVTLHEVLPVEDTSVFNKILGITRMINKYDITPDAVEFAEELNVYLIYGDITVELGQDLLMEEKLARVAAILPSIEGQNGVLHMSDYDGSSDNVVFSKNALSAEGLDEETTKSEEISHEYALVKGEKDAAEEEPSQTETTTPAKQTTEPAVDTEEQTGDADTAAEETEGDIQIDRPVLENLS